jgi:acyl transferase domain-containing protein
MGRDLAAAFPAYATALDHACDALDHARAAAGHQGHPPARDVIWGTSPDLLNQTRHAQAALFATETALARLLQHLGITPHALAGHSIGEVTAAHIAGILTLHDAATLVTARGHLMNALPTSGTMTAIQATETEITQSLAGHEHAASIAAVNGPRAVVISGQEAAVHQIAAHWQAQGRKTSRLAVSHAFHSPLMDPMLDDFRAAIAGLSFHPPRIPLISTVTGKPAHPGEMNDPDYWTRQVRQPVRFADAIASMRELGVRHFIEAGPAAVLSAMTQECLPAADPAAPAPESPPLIVPMLRAGRPEDEAALRAIATLFTAGTSLQWDQFLPPHDSRHQPDLPTYAFQRHRYWLQAARFRAAGDTAAEPGERAAQDSLRYRVAWRPMPEPSPGASPGTWIVVVPSGTADVPWASGAATALAEGGARVITLSADGGCDRATLADQLASAESGHGTLSGVLSLLALDEAPCPGSEPVPTGLALTLELIQACADAGIEAPLWCATRGAVSVAPSERLASPAQAQAWGLGRVAGLESPRNPRGLIDLPEEADEQARGRLRGVLTGQHAEDQVAVRPSGSYVRRVVRAEGPTGAPRPPMAGTVLITGGTGALAAHVARALARSGSRHLVLASRTGPATARARALQAELAGLGAQVAAVACDIADRDALSALLAGLPADQPLTAVYHAAGVIDDGVADTMTREQLATVLGGKAGGARHLHELTRHLDLSAFVLFSSFAATIGNPGQANYAAANAYLDALAEQRRHDGLTATSIAWGPWAEAGMATGTAVAERVRRSGVTPMPPTVAVAALDQALACGDASITIADVDWERFIPVFTAARACPAFDGLCDAPRQPANAGADDGDRAADAPAAVIKRALAAPAAERDGAVNDFVRAEVAAVLGHASAAAIDVNRGFIQLGFDSLMALELRNRLAAAVGFRLPSTLTFDHPTTSALARHLLERLTGGNRDTVPATAELEQLQAALAAIPPGHAAAPAITGRLETMLSRWREAQEAGSTASRDLELETATVDEVLSLIDAELGLS